MSAHWRNLVNTIEPSVCGGDVALCHIPLTTCWELLQVRLFPPTKSRFIYRTDSFLSSS